MNASPTIDTRHVVETAEGARLHLTVAGPIIRGLAWVIDFTIRTVIILAVMFLLFSLAIGISFDNMGFLGGVFLLTYFLISNLYGIVFEASTGTTPGKRIFKLIVVHDNATPISLGGAVVRNLLRTVDSMPFLYFIGLVTSLVDNRFRRLGDLAAGSLVIYKTNEVHFGESFSNPTASAPPNGLSRDERLAIVDFAERHSSLSEQRQQELASKLSHLMDDGVDPVLTLKNWAEWILRGHTSA